MTETEAKWADQVRQWRASGKRAEEFAEGREYKAATLRWWSTALRRRGGGRGRPTPGHPSAAGTATRAIPMAQVVTRARPSEPAAAALRATACDVVIETRGGRVTVSEGADAALLTVTAQRS